MRITQVSSRDRGGGAEHVAWDLFQIYRKLDHQSWLVVGSKTTSDPDVLELKSPSGPWSRFWRNTADRVESQKFRGAWRTSRILRDIAEPRHTIIRWRGREDFYYPATGRLLELSPHRPDILHCHNLHGGFFDLRMLPYFSGQLPLVLTMHDAWLLSGHCSHSFDCDRWQTGCGECPDLSIYPPLERDATSFNWRRKKEIFGLCKMYVTTPSAWLMKKVHSSILTEGIVESRIIPEGVDLRVFRPRDRLEARANLGLSRDAVILVFSSAGMRNNVFKDYDTLHEAMSVVAQQNTVDQVLILALGENGPEEAISDHVKIQFVPFEDDPKRVAQYYQSADLYLHATRADTFPITVLEALACGVPVVASAVGGIPEQIRSLHACLEHPGYPPDQATGILTIPGDAGDMAKATLRLLAENSLRKALGRNAMKDAQRRFDLEIYAQTHLDWYQQILNEFSGSIEK